MTFDIFHESKINLDLRGDLVIDFRQSSLRKIGAPNFPMFFAKYQEVKEQIKEN